MKNSPKLALYVHNTAIRELRWTSLREIQRGKVAFIDNNELCYEETINWDDILVQGTFEVRGSENDSSSSAVDSRSNGSPFNKNLYF